MARSYLWALALTLALPCASPAVAAPVADDGIRHVLSRWYGELAKRDEGRLWGLVAPAYIDASPPYRHVDNGSRALGPRIYTSLAATAPKFAWEIDSIRRDSTFARVQVWERGYFYAWAAKRTYELAAAATFVLERQEKDGSWLILAHQSTSQGIPPNKVTSPMPDLSGLYDEAGRRARPPEK